MPDDGRMADDLRRARSAQTRTRLVETFCALAADGALHPTARQIAERAGCSVRSVFHHFHSLAVLIDEALAVQSARHRPLLAAIPARGDTAGRVAALCRQRRLYFEELLPLYRAAGAPAGTPGAAPVLADDRARMRQQLLATFGPELAAAGDRTRLEALELATGWEAWWSLRADHTPAGAERVMARSACSLVV